MPLMPILRKKYEQKNQALSEKVGRVHNQLELGDDISAMEQKTDLFGKGIVDIQLKTEEYLWPDPKVRSTTKRAKLKACAIDGRSALQFDDPSGSKQKDSLSKCMMSYGSQMDQMAQDYKITSYKIENENYKSEHEKTKKEGGDSKYYGRALVEVGESLELMSEKRRAMEDGIDQDFIQPLEITISKDLNEVAYHRKKMERKRLDYNYK